MTDEHAATGPRSPETGGRESGGGLIEPTEHRRRLAAVLLGLREAAGLNQTDFGARGGMNQSKVSRLETARQVPTLADANAWAEAAGIDAPARERLRERVEAALNETVSMAEYVRHGVAHRQRQIGAQERAVSIERNVCIAIVPGLLQTAEYTRRQFELADILHPELAADGPASLAAWAERQHVLYEPDHRFEFVVTEAALRWRPGPDGHPRVLVTQLRHIASVSTLANVRFGVIPWRTAMRSCPTHGFIIYGEPGADPDVWVHTSTKTSTLDFRDPNEIAVYRRMWDLLCADAVFGDDARVEIERIIAELHTEQP
ncbi:MAG: helix-turn-helix domain-containing protein [Pseudonocardia sp.]